MKVVLLKIYTSDFYESFIEKYFNERVVNYSDYYKFFNKIYLDDAEGKEISEIKTKFVSCKNEINKKYKYKSILLNTLLNSTQKQRRIKETIKFIENIFIEINIINNNKDNINNLI